LSIGDSGLIFEEAARGGRGASADGDASPRFQGPLLESTLPVIKLLLLPRAPGES
jgi:hypothetical protein